MAFPLAGRRRTFAKFVLSFWQKFNSLILNNYKFPLAPKATPFLVLASAYQTSHRAHFAATVTHFQPTGKWPRCAACARPIRIDVVFINLQFLHIRMRGLFWRGPRKICESSTLSGCAGGALLPADWPRGSRVGFRCSFLLRSVVLQWKRISSVP